MKEHLRSLEWLRREYQDRQRTMQDIADECRCTHANVAYWLKKHAIPARPRTPRPVVGAGERYGRLIVTSYVEQRAQGKRFYRCACDCGGTTVVAAAHLRSGDVRSCGCLMRETAAALGREAFTKHGMFGTPTYRSWRSMIARCTHPTATGWEHYGGRGITVCDHWRASFDNFLADMGERPEGMSIDRIDNDGNYEPGNCRWATRSEQRRNMRVA